MSWTCRSDILLESKSIRKFWKFQAFWQFYGQNNGLSTILADLTRQDHEWPQERGVENLGRWTFSPVGTASQYDLPSAVLGREREMQVIQRTCIHQSLLVISNLRDVFWGLQLLLIYRIWGRNPTNSGSLLGSLQILNAVEKCWSKTLTWGIFFQIQVQDVGKSTKKQVTCDILVVQHYRIARCKSCELIPFIATSGAKILSTLVLEVIVPEKT